MAEVVEDEVGYICSKSILIRELVLVWSREIAMDAGDDFRRRHLKIPRLKKLSQSIS